MADRQDGLNASGQGTKRKDLGYWKAAMADIEAKTAAAAAVRTEKGEADTGRKARASSASTLTTPSKLFRRDAPIDSSRGGSSTFQRPPPTFGSVPLERLRSASAPTMPSTPPRTRDHGAASTAPDASTTALAGTTFTSAAHEAAGGTSFGSQAPAFTGQPTVSSGLGGPGFTSWGGSTAFSFGGGTAFGAEKHGGTSAPVASSAAAESSASTVATGGQPQKQQQQGFAGIPPMPTSAPKPFRLPGTATSGASAAQPQKQPQQQGFAGIPPMPTSAPKPFHVPGASTSGASAAQPQKQQQQGFAGIPPMPTSSPKPFQLPGTKSPALSSFGSASSTASFTTTTPSAPASQFSFGGGGTAASFSGFSIGGGGGGQGAVAGVAIQPQNQPPRGTLGQLKPFAPIAESGGFGGEDKVGGGGAGGGMQQPGMDQPQAEAAKKAEGLFGPVKAFGGSTFGASSGGGLFGAIATGSKTEDKASVAPAPTGGSSKGFGGIPPMPSSAPNPFSFSATPTPITTTTANKASASAATSDKPTTGFSGIPPMPTSAPRSAKDLMSSAASSRAVGGMPSSTSSSSAAGATSTDVGGGLPFSSSGFSGIPPMPTSAPRPFSSFTQPPASVAPTNKQSSATPATVKADESGATRSGADKGVVPATGGYAGIPPMAFTAPRSAKEVMAVCVKSGGANKGATLSATSSNAGSSSGVGAGVTTGGGGASGFAGIPPMPTSAPKPPPFALAQVPTPTTTPGTTTSSSAGTGASAKGSAGFAGIPPMPTSAPKPFACAPPPAPPTSTKPTTSTGSSADSGAPVKGNSGFAGMPPMPKAAPRPLKEALSTPSSSASGPASSATAGAKGFSGIPPMSSVAPKPFSAVGLSSASGSGKSSVASSKVPQAATTIFTQSASTSATPFKSVFGTSTPAFGQTTCLGFSTPSDKPAGASSGFGRQATPSTPFASASPSPASTSSPTGAFSGFASRSPGGAASGSIFQSALGGGGSANTTTFGGSTPFTGGLLSSSTSFAQGAAKPSFNFGAPSPEAFKPSLFNAAAASPASKPVVGSGRRRVVNVDDETDSGEDDEESVSTTEGEEDDETDDDDAEEGEAERGVGSAAAVRKPLESLAVGCMAPKPGAVETQGAVGGGGEREGKVQPEAAASSSSWPTLMGGAAKEEVEVGEAEFLGAEGGAYGGDDDDDDDDDDAKEEERASAVLAFNEAADGRVVIDFDAFDELLVRMKVHKSDRGKRKLFDSLAEGEDAHEGVMRDAWAAWYVDYLFGDENEELGDDDDDSEEEEGKERREAQESSSAPMSGGGGWDELRAKLGQDKGWSCSVCMTRNTDDAADKCVACESSRDGKAAPPAPKPKVTEASLPDAFKPASGKGVTSSVFSFGGGVGSGGFSFGAPSTTTATSTTAGGFSFNPTPSATPAATSTTSSSVPQPATTGFTFTGPATGGFSVGAPLSQPPSIPAATAATGAAHGNAEAVEASRGTSAGKGSDNTTDSAKGLTKPSASTSRQEDKGDDACESEASSSWPTLTGGAAKEEVEVGEAEFLAAEGGAYGDDDDEEDMEAQKEEERLEAVAAFEKVAKGRAKLDLKDFEELLTHMNVYVGGDKSNAKLFERLAEAEGADRGVASGSWSAWYVDYVLNDDEEEDADDGDDEKGDDGRDDAAEEAEGHEPQSEFAADGGSGGDDAGWGALRAKMGQDKGWRCSVCMTRNTDEAADKCIACESSRDGKAAPPAAKPKVTEGSLPPAFRSTAASTTSASSFFTNASKGGGISGGGFSFGAPSPTPVSASSFFGSSPAASAPPASTTASAQQAQSTGFSFNAPAVGFSFGAPQPPAPLHTSSEADKAQEEPPVAGVVAGDGRGDATDAGAAGQGGADDTTGSTDDVVKPGAASQDMSFAPSWPTLTGGAAKEEVEVGEAEFLGAEGGAYGGDDNDDDADLEAEKEEERAHAVSVFNEVAKGSAVLDMDGFGKLLEKMSVHKTEKGKRDLFEQLSKDGGDGRGVGSNAWGQWYADFVTEDIDDDDEEGDVEGETEREREADADAGGEGDDAALQLGWGELRAKLGQDKGWSCTVCMTRNADKAADKCVACEASRDGKVAPASAAKPKVTEDALPPAFRPSGGGGSSSLFFSTSTPQGGIGSGGFSFGTGANTHTSMPTHTGFSLTSASSNHTPQSTAPPAPSHITPSGFSFTALALATPTPIQIASTKSAAFTAAPTTGFSYSSSTTNTSPSPTCHPLAGLISEVPSSMATASSSSSSSADSTPARPSVMTQDLQLEVPSDAASSASPSIDVDHDVQMSSPSSQAPGAGPSAPSPTFPHQHSNSLSHDFAHEAYTHNDTHDGGEKHRGTNTSTPEGWVHAGADGDVGESEERPQSVSPVVIDAPELLELGGEGFVDVGGDGGSGEEADLFPLTPPKPLDGDSSSGGGGDAGSRPGRDGMGGLLTPPQPALVQMPSAIRVSDKRRRAEWAFDELDRERTGRLPTGAFNELLAMLSLSYPTAIKPRVIDHCRNVEEGGEDYLCKRKFVEWYMNAADDDDDEFGFGRYTPFKL